MEKPSPCLRLLCIDVLHGRDGVGKDVDTAISCSDKPLSYLDGDTDAQNSRLQQFAV